MFGSTQCSFTGCVNISKLLLHSPPSISMKAPSIVSEAKRALSEEFAVVIGLQTTGEVR